MRIASKVYLAAPSTIKFLQPNDHSFMLLLLKKMLSSLAIFASATTVLFAVLILTKHRKYKRELGVDVNNIDLERYSGKYTHYY